MTQECSFQFVYFQMSKVYEVILSQCGLIMKWSEHEVVLVLSDLIRGYVFGILLKRTK